MVKLGKFKDYFKGYEAFYCLIGGSALELNEEQQGRLARATKDLDLLVIARPETPAFVRRLASFAIAGGYANKKVSPSFTSYRFSKPSEPDYPSQVEIFFKEKTLGETLSRHLDHFQIGCDTSFSAILIETPYYDYAVGNVVVGEVAYLNERALIPLKAKAFINNLGLWKKKAPGISLSDCLKHLRDIVVLLAYAPIEKDLLPLPLEQDLRLFIAMVQAEDYLDWAKEPLTKKEALDRLTQLYLPY